MADVARELLVKLGIQFDDASAKRAEQKVEQLKYAAENMARSFKLDRGVGSPGKVVGDSMAYAAKPADGLLSKVNALRAGLLGLAAAFGAYKIASFVQSTADAADALKTQAEKIGTTTQALQGLQFAAQMNDSSAEALGQGLQFLARSAFAAKEGSKEAQAAFTKLGVKITDASGKLRTTDQIMLDVADGLQKIDSPAEKTAIAMKVLGRGASELVPMLSKGSAEILAFREELDALGGSFATDFVDLADEWNDNGTRMATILKGIGAAVAKGVLKPLDKMVSRFVEFWKLSGEIFRSGLEKFFAGIGKVLFTIYTLIEPILAAFAGLFVIVDWLGDLDDGLQVIIVSVGVLAAAAFGLIAPWALLIGLIALIAEDIYTYFMGGDSVTGKLVETFHGMALEIGEAFSAAFDWIVEKFQWMHDKIRNGIRAIAGIFGDGGPTAAEIGVTGGYATPNPFASSVVNAPSTTNQITVNATPGMDEAALADKVAQKISEYEDARNQEAAGALVPALR
jgi:hypothetical protein